MNRREDMIIVPECGFYNEEINNPDSPYPGECEDCYRYEICSKAEGYYIKDQKMTPKKLYEWAVEHGVEDCEIVIQFRDEYSCYEGYDPLEKDCINIIETDGKKIIEL